MINDMIDHETGLTFGEFHAGVAEVESRMKAAEKRHRTVMDRDEMCDYIKNCDENVIFGGLANPDQYGFCRDIAFQIKGDPTPIVIVWWCNLCTLHIGGLSLHFVGLEYYGPFYDGDEANLVFFRNGDEVARLKVRQRTK